MALAYYSRFLLTTLLLPLLRSAKSSGQEARVLSVCAAGTKQKVDLDDLGMRNASKRWKGTFGWLRKEQEAGVAYNDLMVDVSSGCALYVQRLDCYTDIRRGKSRNIIHSRIPG
jgi:hypothetical protein